MAMPSDRYGLQPTIPRLRHKSAPCMCITGSTLPDFLVHMCSRLQLDLRGNRLGPAGAAALAGVLLKLLDNGNLSVFEIALCLRRLGFDSRRFLVLHFLSLNDDSEEAFIQSASEEGNFMGQFAKDLLTLLDWPIAALIRHAARQVDARKGMMRDQGALVIYLTGDNCDQPSSTLIDDLVTAIQSDY